MEKTEKQIEKDVFRIIRNSELRNAIGGTIYREGMRPKNAATEDIVVKFLTGIDGQEQSGIVLVHIYVPNIASVSGDGELVENITRIGQLQELANQVLADLADTEYLFEKDGTPKSYEAEGVEQHFINVRIKYRRKSF